MFHIKPQNKCQFDNGGQASIGHGRPSKGGSVYTDFMVKKSLRQKSCHTTPRRKSSPYF